MKPIHDYKNKGPKVLARPPIFIGWIVFAIALYISTLGFQAHASVVPAHSNVTTLSSGLVGYWTLDGVVTNWSTGTTLDSSGQGSTGSLVGLSTTTSPTLGKIGQALKFNGTSQYVTVPSVSTLTPSANNFTVSAWVKRNSAGTVGGVVDKSSSYAFAIGVSPCTGSQVKLTKYNVVDLCVGTFPSDTKYHYMTAVWSSTGVSLYIDGILNATSTDTSNFASSASPVTIGYDSGDNAYFNGVIDDVRIYNRALSSLEVKQLYTNGASTVAHSIVTSVSSSLAAYWPLDGNTVNWFTGIAVDASGSGNSGSLVGLSTTTSPIQGKIGQAMYFKSAGQYISASASTSQTTYSVAAWIRYQGAQPVSSVRVATSYGPGGGGSTVWMGVGVGGITISNSSTDLAKATTATSSWHYLVASVQNNTMTAYVDGASIGTDPMTNRTSNTVILGDYVGLGFAFNGSVDDVRVYNRALSTQDVQQLYATGQVNVAHSNTTAVASSLVGYWTFDGSKINWATGLVADASGQGNTGQLVSLATSTSPTIGKVGQALNLNGNAQYIQTTSNQGSGSSLTSITLSSWFKTTTASGTSLLCFNASQDGSSSTEDRFMYVGTDGKLYGYVYDGSAETVNSTNTYTDGKWHLATLSIAAGNKETLYIDGVNMASKSIGTPFTSYVNSYWVIGKCNTGGYLNAAAGTFTGALDDVRIYNRALSATEVAQLYAATK